jgi:hypothetical protein
MGFFFLSSVGTCPHAGSVSGLNDCEITRHTNTSNDQNMFFFKKNMRIKEWKQND